MVNKDGFKSVINRSTCRVTAAQRFRSVKPQLQDNQFFSSPKQYKFALILSKIKNDLWHQNTTY